MLAISHIFAALVKKLATNKKLEKKLKIKKLKIAMKSLTKPR